MDPDPLRLLETAHPLRSRSISQGTPKPRFTIRPNYRLKRPLKLVHKTVNNFIKFVDGPTQMSRPRLVIEDRSGPRGWKKREGKKASGGSFAGTTGKQPRTTTTTRTIGGGMIKGRSLFLGQDGSDCYVCEVPYILGCFCRFAVETYTGRSLRRVSR